MVALAKTCRCGRVFERPARLSISQWAGRRFCSKSCGARKATTDEAQIVADYLSGKSSTELASAWGLSGVQILRIVGKAGATRSASEAHTLAGARPEVRAKLSMASLGKPCPEHVKAALRGYVGPRHHSWRSGITISAGGYLCFTTSPANGVHAGRALHVVIGEWVAGRRLRDGEVIHHKDGNKLNNAPSNLQVMTASDHARHHALDHKFGARKCQAA